MGTVDCTCHIRWNADLSITVLHCILLAFLDFGFQNCDFEIHIFMFVCVHAVMFEGACYDFKQIIIIYDTIVKFVLSLVQLISLRYVNKLVVLRLSS